MLVAAVLCTATPTQAQPYRFLPLATPVGSPSNGAKVNNSGQVVGNIDTNGGSRAVLWNGSTAVPLGLAGRIASTASDVNDSGQVVGYITLAPQDMLRPVIWNGTTPTDLGTLGGSGGVAFGINNAGHVVGSSGPPGDFASRATLWAGAKPVDLGAFTSNSQAYAINDAGQIVGDSEASGFMRRPVLWTDGQMIDLGTLDGLRNLALAVNNGGQVVGLSSLTGFFPEHATLWSNGPGAIDLGTLGADRSFALDFNNAGLIVGLIGFVGEHEVDHAVLWDGTVGTDLNSFLDGVHAQRGLELLSASGINDKGWITGEAINSQTGQVQAFLLTPIPEPSTAILVVVGLVALVLGELTRKRLRTPPISLGCRLTVAAGALHATVGLAGRRLWSDMA